MPTPILSIIIPIYNREKMISRTLNSIIQQEHEDVEVVLIDDGSTDCSVQICNQFVNDYDFISLYTYQNGGVSVARNRGIERAKGDYLLFLDSDDELSDGMIAKLINRIKTDQADILFFDFVYQKLNATIPSIAKVQDGPIKLKHADKEIVGFLNSLQIFCIGAKAYKSAVIHEGNLEYRKDLSIYEDGLFCTEFLKLANSVSHIEMIGYIYHFDSVNSLIRSQKKKFFVGLNAMYQALDELAEKQELSTETINFFHKKYYSAIIDMFQDVTKCGGDRESLIEDVFSENLGYSTKTMDMKYRLFGFAIRNRVDFIFKGMLNIYSFKRKLGRKH